MQSHVIESSKQIRDYQQKTENSSAWFFYETLLGRGMLKLLIRPWFSKLMGIFLDSRYSIFLIKKFIQKNKINMGEYEEKKYRSFNDFFTRKIKLHSRPFDRSPYHIISPCDGKLSAFKIDANSKFYIKNSWYTVEDLLQNKELAKEYEGGDCLIFRLDVTDYHHYCYIDGGWHEKNIYINGEFHSVQPIAVRRYPVYKRNSRSYTILHTENLGKCVQMEIGAMMVGKISNHYENHKFYKGCEKGMFEFGGSTIVLLFQKGVITLDNNIILNAHNDLETLVKMGEKIGIKKER